MEIDKKKVVGYVKTYATIAKDKVVATWKSGAKGKFACVVGAVIILLGLKSCLTGDDDSASGDVLGAEYRFSEEDFRTESDTEKMFYVKDGDDDGIKEVVPNLKQIPPILAADQCKYITEGYRPQNDQNVGKVFFTDPDSYSREGLSTVTHVDDGWIVVRTDARGLYGDYSGFIYTHDDETYIEGQKLKAGYYVLLGTQKVPLVNGSSMTMCAFTRLDSESNRLALEAKNYNEKAQEETRKENDRRAEYKRHQEDFAEHIGEFQVVDFEKQIFLPEDLKGRESCFRLLSGDELEGGVNDKKISFTELRHCVAEKDFGAFCKLEHPYDGYPSDLLRNYLKYTRTFDINGAEGWIDRYTVYVISRTPRHVSRLYFAEPKASYELALKDRLWVIDKSDKEANTILEKSFPDEEDLEKIFKKYFQ